MEKIIVKTQEDWDKLSDDFKGDIVIDAASVKRITISEQKGNSITILDESSVIVQDSVKVVARGIAYVNVHDSSQVEAWDDTRIKAWDSSQVVAKGNAYVLTYNSARVQARKFSRIYAYDTSQVVARDHSRVEASDSSHVVARDNVLVEVRDNSSTVARDNVEVHKNSADADINLVDNAKITRNYLQHNYKGGDSSDKKETYVSKKETSIINQDFTHGHRSGRD